MEDSERLRQLEARLADLRARLQAHSVPPSMLMEIEDLEDLSVALSPPTTCRLDYPRTESSIVTVRR